MMAPRPMPQGYCNECLAKVSGPETHAAHCSTYRAWFNRNYVEPVWREGVREVARIMAIGMAIAVLLSALVIFVAGWYTPEEPRILETPHE